MNNITEKLWNIQLVVEDLKNFPQTYNTILGDFNSGTNQTILRRKLNNLCKDGTVYKTTIPGTRFGKVIFYCSPRKYILLFEGSRTGSNVYCFFEFIRLSKFYIKLNKYWELEKGIWIEKENKTIFEGNVLKWI